MSADCCPEPVAGPVVGTRVLRHAWTALGPLRRGSWPATCSLEPGGRRETLAVLDGVLAGLYLAVDADGRLRWLGKAHRGSGVSTRLRDHLRHPERARVFTAVYVIEADPFSPRRAIEAAEGRAADAIGLRGRMGPRTWPVVTQTQWLALVTSRLGPRVYPPRLDDDSNGRGDVPA
ncbi:hypothetical protein [Streptomyces griseus]